MLWFPIHICFQCFQVIPSHISFLGFQLTCEFKVQILITGFPIFHIFSDFPCIVPDIGSMSTKNYSHIFLGYSHIKNSHLDNSWDFKGLHIDNSWDLKELHLTTKKKTNHLKRVILKYSRKIS